MDTKKFMVTGILVALTMIFSGCQKEQHGYLIGEWSGVDKMGMKQTFIFRQDNRAEWMIKSAEMTQKFELAYKINYESCPITIDLSGFESGPLQGKALYGIIEFKNNAMFRLDVEPGVPDGDKPIHRPAVFGDETVTYYRVTN